MKLLAAAFVLGLALVAGARADSLTPLQLVDRVEARFRATPDYECVMESEIQGPKGVEKGRYRVWFKQPGLIRIRVDRGSHRGSEVSLTKAGNVRAHAGGILRAFVTTMKKTDSRLRDPQGNYAWESDFGSYYRRLRERLQLSEYAEIKPGASGENHLELCLTYADPQTHKPRREVWHFAPDSWVLLRMTAFEDGRQVETAEFREFKENVGIKDSFFDL